MFRYREFANVSSLFSVWSCEKIIPISLPVIYSDNLMFVDPCFIV
jgi:hypothetical protein